MRPDTLARGIAEYYRGAQTARAVVRGSSMAPGVVDGQEVEVVPVRGALEPGRCYVYLRDRALVAHRLVKATSEGLQMAGDAGAGAETIPRALVVGEMPLAEPAVARGAVAIVNRLCFASGARFGLGVRRRLLRFLHFLGAGQ